MIQIKTDITGLKREAQILRYFYDFVQDQVTINARIFYMQTVEEEEVPITSGRFVPFDQEFLITDIAAWTALMENGNVIQGIQAHIISYYENKEIPDIETIEL